MVVGPDGIELSAETFICTNVTQYHHLWTLYYNNFLFTVHSTSDALDCMLQNPPFYMATRYRYLPEAARKLNLLMADIRKHRTL